MKTAKLLEADNVLLKASAEKKRKVFLEKSSFVVKRLSKDRGARVKTKKIDKQTLQSARKGENKRSYLLLLARAADMFSKR